MRPFLTVVLLELDGRFQIERLDQGRLVQRQRVAHASHFDPFGRHADPEFGMFPDASVDYVTWLDDGNVGKYEKCPRAIILNGPMCLSAGAKSFNL